MRVETLRHLALCALGYVAAGFAGYGAVAWKNHGVSEPDMMAMSGMYAFGDSVCFLIVAAGAAVVPTVGVFRLIGSSRFWRLYETSCLLVASTACIAALLLMVPVARERSPLTDAQALSFMRLWTAPIWLLAFAPGVILGGGRGRRRFVIASVLEIGAIGSFLLGAIVRSF